MLSRVGEPGTAIVESKYTPHQAAYFAHELVRRASSDDPEKLGASLFNATVDLNPHQVEASLFAFRSPLSRGAILCDEVGLGKTIEAGLIVSQLWAERKRRILVICPTILRKQWAQELIDKFSIDSVVLDTRTAKKLEQSDLKPFEPKDKVVICSFHFASAHEADILAVPWNLIVIDEAHRMRNVWKNDRGMAAHVRTAVQSHPLVLLTATPLQNSLLELYGLTTFIDEHIFGDLEAFRARYMRGPTDDRDLADLKMRLAPICQRTLRRQVQEYIKFTSRIPITQGFQPHEDEQRLYDLVSEFLQRKDSAALPARQRHLMTLVMRKLLASSSFAIANTLEVLIDRLAVQHGDALMALEQDYETAEELTEEWEEEEPEQGPVEAEQVRHEIEELGTFVALARSISTNAKGEALLQALDKGFEKLTELGAGRKAVIFTESRRTQQYLLDLLATNGYSGRLVAINGTNDGKEAQAAYALWKEKHKGEPVVSGNKAIDIRTALVEHFRDEADILVATEAAAEGINLQFCSLLVNYDLPWNPQRIEQRIGRCHRYGQKFDVVVVNFLNQANEADLRVFELLNEKFRLFEGVFGASDQVLGALESGVDFERRILDIYQSCRTKPEIDQAFDQLQLELGEEITTRMDETQRKILENFDQEVQDRIRASGKALEERLDTLQTLLWKLTVAELHGKAKFDGRYAFELTDATDLGSGARPGKYKLAAGNQEVHGAERYRLDHPIAQTIIDRAAGRALDPVRVVFDYTNSQTKAGILEPHVGKSGWLCLTRLTLTSLDDEDELVFAVLDDSLDALESDIGPKLLQQEARECEAIPVPWEVEERLKLQNERLLNEITEQFGEKNRRFFEDELDKLERWAEDKKHGLETTIKDIDREIKRLAREARLEPRLEAKVERTKEKAKLEAERNRKRRELFDAQDEIEAKKQQLLDDIEARLKATFSRRPVLTLRWEVR
jgi:adenine-specific DNA-methyltransferase